MSTLLLAEDHRLTRTALREILELEPDFEVVGEAQDGLEAARLLQELRPDVLVCDLMMPGLNGLDLTARIGRAFPEIRVVIVSNYVEQPYVTQALRNGALGYVDKGSCAGHLAKAVRAALASQTYLSPALPELPS